MGVVGMSNYPDGMTSADHAYLDGYSGCLHESTSVEDVRVRVRIPMRIHYRRKGDYIEVDDYEFEAYFTCDKCSAGKWLSVDVDSYVEDLDCQGDDLED
tara:strand:- start:3240 stop:3536 length:297 start_codon:yes stop_codon:yes gene_type:complete